MKQFIFLFLFLTIISFSACNKQNQNVEPDKTVKTVNATEKAEYKCDGMHCSGCEETITNELKKLDGVAEIKADSKAKTVFVTYDPSKTNKDAISKSINAAGYDTQISDSDNKHDCDKDLKDKKK